MPKNFMDQFNTKKTIIGMLHLKGINEDDIFDRMKKELDIYINSGIDCVIIENYFGTYKSLKKGLDYLEKNNLPIPYGVNCLNVDQIGFDLAKEYHANFVQLDSVIGHVKPRDEDTLDAFFEKNIKDYPGYILGGVRFKYQPVLSDNSTETDLKLSKSRCDAVCVTSDATGMETPLDKIKLFRSSLEDFPLIIGAGVTPQNMEKQFQFADGAIIGSYFKKGHLAENEIDSKNVLDVINTANRIREEY